MTTHKRPRSDSARVDRDVLKLHRRTIVADRREFTVIALRPGSDFRFSTNIFHGTWHVLSDWRGARILARLMWGLAFQRKPGTLVLIDRPSLDPNPFDAAPADPIVLLPSNLTVLSGQAARTLRQRRPLRTKSDGTVRWRTHGLAQAVNEEKAWQDLPTGQRHYPHTAKPTGWHKVDRIGGVITFAAEPATLREWAVEVARLGDWCSYGMDYTESQWPEGEIQVFRQYRSEVSIARQARGEVLSSLEAQSEPQPNPEQLERQIWDHAETVRRRRLPLVEVHL